MIEKRKEKNMRKQKNSPEEYKKKENAYMNFTLLL